MPCNGLSFAVREKLVGVEQQGASICLRALTEENAEQAVQRAIFALTEAGNGPDVQAKESEKPPIPIAELPARSICEGKSTCVPVWEDIVTS